MFSIVFFPLLTQKQLTTKKKNPIQTISQEGVHVNLYIPLVKEIYTIEGEVVQCRVYQMVNTPTDIINLSSPKIAYERQPSKTYLETIIKGAEESELPAKYCYFLKKIVHNGCIAHPDMLKLLNL